MSTEIATRQPHGSTLVLDHDQTYWTDPQIRVLQQIGVKDATPADLAVFFHQAQRTGLDPFAKQIYMIGRRSKENNQWITKQTIQTGIDGFRLIARRAADKAGESIGYADTEWCSQDGSWSSVWLSDEPPAAARVIVLREGHPFPGVALWREYKQTKSDGGLTPMWSRMPANQLAKCAEAQALRKAFPQDLSGLYTDDEMAHQDTPTGSQRNRQRVQRSSLNDVIPAAPDPVEAELVDDPDVEAEAQFAEETP